MTDDIVDPSEPLRAEYERQLVELQEMLEAATSRRDRSRVRRRIRRLQRHFLSSLFRRLRDGWVTRW